MNNTLTQIEKSELSNFEQIISDNLLSFYLIGMALLSIKEKKLYRAKYKTFENYVAERWKLSRSHAYQLVNAATVYHNIAELENKDRKIILPTREIQIRSLANLPKVVQQSVWLKAIELSNGKTPTGEEIRLLVNDLNKNEKQVFRKISKAIQSNITTERRSERITALAEESKNFKPLTKEIGKFTVLLADPPWQYSHAISENRAIENHYNTMDTEEIASLPVNEICTRSAVLFLWVPNPKLEEGIYVLNEWGFTYRTCMVWVKDRIGTGYWTRAKNELLLIGTKGDMPCPEESTRPESVIVSKRQKHSEKPEILYHIIEKMYPSLEKIELFARKEREHWNRW